MDYRPALRERTGVGEYVHELASALARRLAPEDSLALFSSSWRDRLASDAVPGADTIDRRIPVRVLNFAWHRFEWPPIERLAGTVDVAHSIHPLLMPSRAAGQLVTIHDLDFLDHPERTRGEIRRDYAGLASSHARRADRVIAVSRFTARQIVDRLEVPSERITVCSPGAPPWTPRTEHRSAGPILFVGTLEARKNVGTLLRAYGRVRAQVPSAPRLVLAGRRTPDADAWLRMAVDPPLAGQVEYLGYIRDEERRGLFDSASMFVLPSYHEGFGIPVLEAMAAGVPVVVSRRGALPEVVGDAGALVDPEDEEGLAAAMVRYLTDSQAATDAAARGVRRAREYSWDASAQTLYDAYARAIARRRAAEARGLPQMSA